VCGARKYERAGRPALVARALRAGPAGVRILAPEVLLYRIAVPRAADEHDFGVARGCLDAEARM
jgi:hypothetical protein